ncbi:MAG: hypothetical protein LQ346_005913 [Caloplaca aetnensis]|nr:MAG: hypothetical protein LQ346_005913 [Caloplaca aetnensis]
MDSSSLSNLDISKLSDADKRDLQQQVNNEMQKAKLNEAIHTLTDICWTKCISGAPSSGKLSSKEESCASNCVERFMDANTAVLRHLQVMQGEGM